ncbi:hypothetical protein [Hyunsoonleella pacifica]|uniref:DUF4345 domain-containing protein n=1 Tax=Hyunsoonleella pacifica TaxID=1080224 RepID=A0A4Q9FKK4_9FLAO|nr:hypothetical protein [Hyunsoonleella pacifica]TBN12459.1 hypothetical protein EYD46_17220 [Hyunsoonleella pacifica]GGD29286.1 hypothetical protein GCM10011368_34130 [Hyunsoonleella pacifica]
MNIHIQIIGSLLVTLSLIHLAFPKYFNWKTEFQSLSLFNKQMVGVHTFFIALIVFLMGLLCLFSTKELITTSLGKTICLGLGVFWGIRLLFQLFVYSPKLWKGKRFETIIHMLFTGLWAYITIVFMSVSLKI